MSTLGGTRGERNAKPKFAALDINKLYITSRGESLEPSSQKSAVPRKHGMQSLGKVPTARRPPANLPSLKAEVGNPGEQSGSWTSDYTEGQNLTKSSSDLPDKNTTSPNASVSSTSAQHQPASLNNSKTCESSWNTNEFPSLDGTGSYGGNVNSKSQQFQDHYPGASQSMMRPHNDPQFRAQQKGSNGRGTVPNIATEDTDGGGGGGNSVSGSTMATNSQSPPLPPQFRALLPPFMQRGSDSGLTGNENEGGSSSLPPVPAASHLSTSVMNNDSKNNNIVPNVTNNGNNLDNSKMSNNSGKRNNNYEGIANSSNFGTVNTAMNTTKPSNQFPQKQPPSSVLHSQQQQNSRIGGGHNFSSMPTSRGGRVVRGASGAGSNPGSEGNTERASGAGYNDNYLQAHRRGAMNHQPRYANRGMTGVGAGNYNSSAGHVRNDGGGGNVGGSGNAGSPSGFHEDSRNSHPPYGSGVLTEQEVVVRPIIRDEELQRLEAIAKDEGWAKDYEFDYNQKLEFSDDESEINPTPTAAKDKHTTMDKEDNYEKNTTGAIAEKETDSEKVDRNNRGQEHGGGPVAYKERESKQDQESNMIIGNVGSGVRGEGGVINVNITAGGLDAAEAKERIKQRREEDQKREIERKQAAARKLQELEEKLSRKKNDESVDSKPGNNDKGSGGGVNVAVSSAGNVTSSSNRSEEEKSVEGIAAHTSERTISIKIRGKSGERANVKDIRYDFGTGGGGARHDRDGGNVVGGNAGTNWDLPGFSKTFQSNLPPRFQKRKLERNTSGTNLSTNANNATGNQIASRTSNSYSSSGSTGPAAINAGSEIKSTIPFAQQYDPRYIHNQQTYGRGVTANAMSNSRRSGMVTSGAPVRDRERDERPRQQYDTRDTHNQREATKEKADTAEENSRFGGGIQDSSSNQAKQTTGGRITPQLVRSLSESSNRKTSISSDENHHNVAHHASSATHNSGSVATKSGNYGREKSWDMEAEKGSSASSPASFSGSERHREIPLRFDNDQPKQILHRVKEMTSQISEVVKEDKIVIKRIARSGESEGESEQKDTGLESGKHPLSDNAATVQDSKTSFAIDVTDPDRNSIDSNAAAENVNKMFQTEEISSFGVVEPNIKENMENEGSKDVAHLDNSYQSRALSGADDKKQLAASSVTVSASSQQHSGKKKGVPLVQQQQHPRDNRRHDTRGGSRGGSYSGGYHRADLTGSSSTLRGGTSNWNRARGGNRAGAGSRSYNQDYWSESEFSEEGFDEQPKHHLHQKIYNHSMMGTTGAQNTDIGSITSKEGFVPRGEPSRRGRGGGNVGSTVVVASSSNTANRQKQQQASFSGCGVSSMDGAGNISKKMEGYGPPSSKSPFGGGTGNGGDDRNTKHRVGDSLSSNASAGSPTRDDRDVQKRTRPISFTDAGKAMEDTPTSIDHEKLCAIVGERKPGAIEVRNDESHSTEDNVASQKPGGRSNVSENRMAMESSDAGVANKPGTITEDMKTKSKSIVTPITSKIGSSLTTSLVEGSSNIANNNPPDSNLASIGIARGSGNNHLVTRKQQQTASRGQGAKLSNTDTMTDISSGGSNATQAVPNLMNINNSGGKAAANIVTRPTTIPIDGERSSHLQQQQQQQSVTEKLAASSPVNNAKTDNDKHNLDGNTPPVNTIIFENTNFKSGVSVAVLSGSSSSPVVVDCGGVGGDTTMNSLRRQQSGNSVTNFGAKVNAGLMNEKMAGGAAGVVGALQSMTSSASSHRPIASPTVTAANESGLQHNIVGSSQRTALSAGVPKQQPCNMIASSIQGIPFQKSENDYKDIKSYAFETDISHLIDGDKGMKQQSSVSAGLCLSKSIEAEGGGNNHGAGVAVSVKNMISPSTADLNMKIASVKKVWEMPTVPEQAGSVVNAGSASSANRVNVASEHSVSGGGSGVGGGSNVHLKSNFVRGPHHASHQPQYQHPHPGSANHHAHPTHGTHQSYAAAFGSDSDSLVDHFNNSNSVCNVSSSAGVANNGCDMNSAINLNNECSDSSSGGYGLSHHHSQQQPAKSHQQQTQAHQLQQQHQQELQHQRQSHNMAESSSQQSSQQQHVQQQQKQLQQHQPQHSLQQHTQQMQRQQQQHKEQPQHMQQLQQLHQQTQQSQHKTQTQSQSQPQSQLQTQAPSQSQPQSQTQTSQSQSQAQSQLKTQQQSQQLPQQLTQSQAQQHPHQHQQQHPGHKQSQLQQQLQQHPVQQHPQQMQQSHHQQSLQLQHQQQTQQQSQQQHVSSVGVQQQQQQQHQAAVAVSLGLNKQHPVADALAAAVAANVNVCKVKPTQQNNGSGMHQSSSMGLSPPPQMQSGSIPSAPQPFYPAQYGVSAIPSPPAVLYNSPAVAAAAMNSQGGLYNAFQIEPSGRSQFSQFPGHYGTSGTAGPYNAYMTTPTNMQAGPTPEMFQSLSSQFRMGSVQSPYNQTTQMGNPNTMLISSNNSSLMSSSVKSSTQQIGAIGQPKPNGGGSVSQPPYGQQYLNMFPPAPLQNTAANYYSSSGGNQTAFFGTAAATGAGTQNAYGIPAAAVAASNMFGSHGGQNPSNTPQPPPPQQQMPSYSSQFLNSPLLAATNPAMGQQQYRGAPNNSSQHSGANAAAYIKSNQSPQSSHIQQQQQQQQQDWELQNQLMQHQPQIANLQGQSAPSQQLSLLSTGPASAQQNTQGTQHLSNNRNTLPVNQANNQFVGCGGGSNSAPGNGNPVVASGGGNVNTGPSSIRGHPPAQAQGASGTRYPSPIQRPTNFAHAQSLGVQHHQQRGGRPIGYGQQNVGTNGGGGHQPQGSGSNVAQGVNNSSKHFYGGNRG